MSSNQNGGTTVSYFMIEAFEWCIFVEQNFGRLKCISAGIAKVCVMCVCSYIHDTFHMHLTPN